MSFFISWPYVDSLKSEKKFGVAYNHNKSRFDQTDNCMAVGDRAVQERLPRILQCWSCIEPEDSSHSLVMTINILSLRATVRLHVVESVVSVTNPEKYSELENNPDVYNF
jgi:hypothetical protein